MTAAGMSDCELENMSVCCYPSCICDREGRRMFSSWIHCCLPDENIATHIVHMGSHTYVRTQATGGVECTLTIEWPAPYHGSSAFR
jgi:hypothetical protein